MAKVREHIAKTVPPECHPEAPYFAGGLCKPCYMSKRYKNDPERYKNLARKWLKENPEKSRLHRRRGNLKKLGATIEQYETLWTEQGGKCANAACSFESPLVMTDYRQGLQVDHDHKTGAIRNLLCPRCNTSLGHVDDSAALLRGLADYIDGFR